MKTTPDELELLIAAAGTAWRPRDADGQVQAHPAWHDLDHAGRERAFQATAEARALEAALDPDNLSTTGRAVLARIRYTRP